MRRKEVETHDHHEPAVDSAGMGPANSAACGEPANAPEMIGRYRVHEAARAFPLMEGSDFDDLVASIEAHGQRDAVDVQEDVLIEGRNRARAVELLNSRGCSIELRTAEWQPSPGQTVAEYVADKNLHRRHLTPAQRAQIAADLVPMIERERASLQEATRIQRGQVLNPSGINQHTADRKGASKTMPPSDKKERGRAKTKRSTVGKVAAMAGVTHYAASQAVSIKKQGSPETVAAVKSGKKKAKEAVAEITTASKPKPPIKKKKHGAINHPFSPKDDFERDVLFGWIRLVEQKLGIAERPRARKVLRAILKAEDAVEKSPKAPKQGGKK